VTVDHHCAWDQVSVVVNVDPGPVLRALDPELIIVFDAGNCAAAALHVLPIPRHDQRDRARHGRDGLRDRRVAR
jgi:hypothetical protein